MDYQAIIGLEIHLQLKTRSKMFCACPNDPRSAPANLHTCPICLGHPGTLPAVNEQAVELGVLLALALEAKLNLFNKFDRKNYFYPDLPKGYQISQYDLPLARGGRLRLQPNREVAITRLHLEEDTGKLLHSAAGTLIDFNRAGATLLELVTEPVLRSAAEAKLFCERFQQLARYLNISEAAMEKGLMRCEANVSVQQPGVWRYGNGQIYPVGDNILNHKAEVKNINSFRSLERAINFEIKRQSQLLNNGKTIKAETRGWDDKTNQTKRQRSKETSADYRYFPEPDLPPLSLSQDYVERARRRVVELPWSKEQRLQTEYGLPTADALTLAVNPRLSDYYEEVVSELRAWIDLDGDGWERQNRKLSKITANWLITEVGRLINNSGQGWPPAKISANHLASLVKLVYKNEINSSAAQTILNEMFVSGQAPTDIMRRLGLEQIDDSAALETIIKEIAEDNPDQWQAYVNGKEALAKFFMGKVMAASGGKANPQVVQQILDKLKQ